MAATDFEDYPLNVRIEEELDSETNSLIDAFETVLTTNGINVDRDKKIEFVRESLDRVEWEE